MSDSIIISDGEYISRHYKDHPVEYQRDVLRYEPDDWQCVAFNSVRDNRRTSVVAGHGVGKTRFAAGTIHWFFSTRPFPTGVVTANTLKQLTGKTWRELAKVNQGALNRDWFDLIATRFYLKESPSTWFCDAVPWSENNAEAFAGTHEEHVLILFDEASAIPNIIYETAEGAMTTAGARMVALGNGTRATGWFRESFGKRKHRWNNIHVDARTAKHTDKAQIKAWIEDYGLHSDFVKVRVLGEFPNQSATQFIATDTVDEAVDRDVPDQSEFAIILGVDVAREGDDQTVIAVRQGRKLLELRKYRNLRTPQIVGYVAQAIDEHSPTLCNIDSGNIGASVYDYLVQQGYSNVVRLVNFGDQKVLAPHKHPNMRCQMWWDMRDWLETGSIPDDASLKEALLGPEYSHDDKQRVLLEKKKEMKDRGLASPDEADALCLTFAFSVTQPKRKKKKERKRPRMTSAWMAA